MQIPSWKKKKKRRPRLCLHQRLCIIHKMVCCGFWWTARKHPLLPDRRGINLTWYTLHLSLRFYRTRHKENTRCFLLPHYRQSCQRMFRPLTRKYWNRSNAGRSFMFSAARCVETCPRHEPHEPWKHARFNKYPTKTNTLECVIVLFKMKGNHKMLS